jgi:manganese efflux pump family protein
MDFLSILVIALGLSADCFAVAISGGATQEKFSILKMCRLALIFGFFQGMMTIIGWFLGNTVVDFIASFDHWIAFVLLLVIGCRMIWESFSKDDDKKKVKDITWGLTVFTLAIATSIDALAVGLSLSFLKINILYPAVVIGIVAFILTSVGFWIGKKVSSLLGKRAQLAGGIILILIGIRILLEHLL